MIMCLEVEVFEFTDPAAVNIACGGFVRIRPGEESDAKPGRPTPCHVIEYPMCTDKAGSCMKVCYGIMHAHTLLLSFHVVLDVVFTIATLSVSSESKTDCGVRGWQVRIYEHELEYSTTIPSTDGEVSDPLGESLFNAPHNATLAFKTGKTLSLLSLHTLATCNEVDWDFLQ
jgi:hypothetical protein